MYWIGIFTQICANEKFVKGAAPAEKVSWQHVQGCQVSEIDQSMIICGAQLG